MKSISRILFILIVILVASFLFGKFVLPIIANRFREVEKVQCLEWEQMAENRPGFYTTQWQKEQCEQFGISFQK